MNDIYFNTRYLELTASLAKASKQMDLYHKVIRILHLTRNLAPDLIEMNDAINEKSLEKGIPPAELFPEYQEWNKLETRLYREKLEVP